ncbi:glycosyltransferase family 4 protein [bacterium]|nr:glycosyltransferase family 4 protein [bacterium]
METNNRFVSVFSGSRDHYQVPLALAESNMLETLVTDIYMSDHQIAGCINNFTKHLGLDLSNRRCHGLSSKLVTVDTKSALLSLASRLRPTWKKLVKQKDSSLSIRAVKESIQKNAVLFAYSYYAAEAFRILERQGMPRLLFQVHPHPKYVRDLFLEEMELVPSAKSSFLNDSEVDPRNIFYDTLCEEPELATNIVAASSFTKKTLLSSGICDSKITVIPYGVDNAAFQTRTAPPAFNGPLKVIFVGQISQRKGLSYLFDAVRRIGPEGVHLKCFTRKLGQNELFQNYSAENISVVENASRAELAQSMREAEVFAMPSLAEGFGLVIAESMASGLPVLTTLNGAGADLIRDKHDGFIVPIRNTEAIEETLLWGLDNRVNLYEMGQRAATKISEFTWQRFRNRICDFSNAAI